MFPEDIEATSRRVITAAERSGLWLTTAESCTGGLIGAALTAIPGSSAVYGRGFITYSNAAKSDLLDVSDELLIAHGAVSEAVARAMAEGARRRSGAGLAVSVTGIAGPGGGSPQKPVGRVHFGLAYGHGEVRHHVESYGDLGRCQVRLAALRTALGLLEWGLSQAVGRP
ncbi:MAG: CinA family protein [Caulobacterales bacterium]|nr:CinA family protein [Caulobacterales bacterium]